MVAVVEDVASRASLFAISAEQFERAAWMHAQLLQPQLKLLTMSCVAMGGMLALHDVTTAGPSQTTAAASRGASVGVGF